VENTIVLFRDDEGLRNEESSGRSRGFTRCCSDYDEAGEDSGKNAFLRNFIFKSGLVRLSPHIPEEQLDSKSKYLLNWN
jgi:hypothetical protein